MDWQLEKLIHRTRKQGTWVWLFAITAPGGSDPVLTITDNPTGDVVYAGATYLWYDCGFKEPPAQSSDGALPMAILRISGILLSLQDDLAASDWWRGGTVAATPYNTAAPTADYSDLTKTLEIVCHDTPGEDLEFTLSTPGTITDPVPEDSYNPYGCRTGVAFRGLRCGYAGQTIQAVTLSGTDPVSIQCNGHGITDGAAALLETVGGISPSLNGVYTIAWVDANNFTLDDTDSSDYAGPYTSGGLAGFAYCEKHLTACRARAGNFGGFPSLHPEGMRIAV